MTKSFRIYILPIILLVAVSTSFAQHFGRDMRNFFDYGEQFYGAAEQNADGSALDVRVNTANALFSFLKTDKAHAALGDYFAVRDIAIELREKPAGKVLKTVNTRDTIYTNSFAATTSKTAWVSYIRSIQLEGIPLPQTAEVHIEVRDGFLARLANSPTTINVALRSYHSEKSLTAADTTFIGLGDVHIFETLVDPYTYRSKNWGNSTEFSHDINGGLNIALNKNLKIDSIIIRLTQLSDILEEKKFQSKSQALIFINSEDIITDKTITSAEVDSEIVYKISDFEKKDSSYKFYTALFKIPGKMLEQGKYRMDVRVVAAGTSRSFSQPIELQWHDMPLSLENPRDAIPPLMHITTDEEFKELSRGSREEQIKKLYTFWKKQDPTPETAYNEKMAEFYRRADYAYFNFAHSARLLDGALTDRGKIYILFGPPTNIERTFLLGEQPTEIWTYSNNVKKIVKFTDPGGHGDYKLTEVKQM